MDFQEELLKHLIYISYLKGRKMKHTFVDKFICFREINFMVFKAYWGDILSIPIVKQCQ